MDKLSKLDERNKSNFFIIEARVSLLDSEGCFASSDRSETLPNVFIRQKIS